MLLPDVDYNHFLTNLEKVKPRPLKGGKVRGSALKRDVWTTKLLRFENSSKLYLPDERPMPLV